MRFAEYSTECTVSHESKEDILLYTHVIVGDIIDGCGQ